LLSINCTPNKFQMKMDRTQTKILSIFNIKTKREKQDYNHKQNAKLIYKILSVTLKF
jgi:hypothetical protein